MEDPSVPTDLVIEADCCVIIIGAGPATSALVAEPSGLRLRIVLLSS